MQWWMPMLLLALVTTSGCIVRPSNNGDDDDAGDDDDVTEPPSPSSNCADWVPPEPPIPTPDPGCMNLPLASPSTFEASVEWQWSENPINPGYTGVMATPAVGNLTDDNGDGIIDDTDVPDIVFTSYPGGSWNGPGALTAISGDGSGTHWSILTAGGFTVTARAAAALGDIDADGAPDVCIPGYDVAVLCVDGATGAFKWGAGSELGRLGAVSFADLTQDGLAEVIFGRQVFDAFGNELWVGAYGRGTNYDSELSDCMSIATDVDGDGTLEVVAGNTVYDHLGEPELILDSEDSLVALGDFVGDGRPEIVQTGFYDVALYDLDGNQLWRSPNPDVGRGGPPTVADFDGDRRLEIGVATKGNYTVWDTDGSVLWSQVVDDSSSGSTGSAVFDFDADGANEVVYADEHTVYVFDGATGAVRMGAEGHKSPTGRENPIIVDVDNDAETEIVVPSDAGNDPTAWEGITVLGAADQPWTPARPIWNQHAYHITNVNNDASIPAVQTPNWTSWNNFRTAGTEVGPSHWLPDVMSTEPETCLDLCWDGRVELWVPVGNQGLVASNASTLHLVRSVNGVEEVVLQQEIPGTEPGDGSVLGPLALSAEEWGDALFVLLDADDALLECAEEANRVALGPWPCPTR